MQSTTFIPLDITQVFQDKWPEFTLYAVIAIVGIVVVWRIARFYYTNYSVRMRAVEDKVRDSDCARHGRAINDFDGTTKIILHKIDFIEKALIASDKKLLSAFAKSNSPLQLNQRAIDLMTSSGADRILERHRDVLIKQIEELNPATAYDVEQNAYKVLILNSDASWFIPLKEYIFNNPVFQGENISMDAICFVMSLPLRDYYFNKHPEID
jgi:hypothetical protein